MNIFIQLEGGNLLNLSQIIEVFRSDGRYWVKTIVGSFTISESDFNKLQNLSI